MDLVRGFAGLAAGLGQGVVANATAQREENLRRLEQKFRSEEAATDRAFRGEQSALDRDQRMDLFKMSEEGANRRAAASRTPSARFASYQTGADGKLYGITRDGKAEVVTAGDGAFEPAGEAVEPYSPSKDAREAFEKMLERSPEFADKFATLPPPSQADAMRDWTRRYERGAGPTAQTAAASPAAASPPSAAIADLRADPSEDARREFDEAFGAGAAAAALGSAAAAPKAETPPARGFGGMLDSATETVRSGGLKITAREGPSQEEERRPSGSREVGTVTLAAPGDNPRSSRRDSRPSGGAPDASSASWDVASAVDRVGGVGRIVGPNGSLRDGADAALRAIAAETGRSVDDVLAAIMQMIGAR